MTLSQMLRQDFGSKIRPLLIKNQCEVCYSETEQLHLHHTTYFQELLMETLNELQLELHDDDYEQYYTEFQIEMIRNVMLGKQMRIDYITCCESCHLEIHEGNYFKGYAVSTRKDKSGVDEYAAEEVQELVSKLEELVTQCEVNERSFIGKDGLHKIANALQLYAAREYQKGKMKRYFCTSIKAINDQLILMELPFEIEQVSYRTRINGKQKRITYYTVVRT